MNFIIPTHKKAVDDVAAPGISRSRGGAQPAACARVLKWLLRRVGLVVLSRASRLLKHAILALTYALISNNTNDFVNVKVESNAAASHVWRVYKQSRLRAALQDEEHLLPRVLVGGCLLLLPVNIF